MKRSLVVAIAQNRVIGRNGGLPWRLPEDLKRFRKLTLGSAVIMGRRTWESLPNGPLKRRLNIVVSQREGYQAEGALVARSLEAAFVLAASGDVDGEPVSGIAVIGGARLYAEAIASADTLHVTWVLASVEGDVRFPEIDWARWTQVDMTEHPADARHAHGFQFATYERARGSASPSSLR